jgi:hypothetical protein
VGVGVGVLLQDLNQEQGLGFGAGFTPRMVVNHVACAGLAAALDSRAIALAWPRRRTYLERMTGNSLGTT